MNRKIRKSLKINQGIVRFMGRRVLFPSSRRAGAFSLLECLVYVAMLMVIMALLSTVYYHADWNHRNLNRNAADIVRALQAGERWREDVRLASGPIQPGPGGAGQELSIPHTNGLVRYAFRDGAVWRQAGQPARWQEALAGVSNSRMEKEKPPVCECLALGSRAEVAAKNRASPAVVCFRGGHKGGPAMRVRRTNRPGGPRGGDRSRQRGSAVLLVLVFLVIVELLAMSNARTLDHLKRELKLIEKQQQAKFSPAGGALTNQPAARRQPQEPRP